MAKKKTSLMPVNIQMIIIFIFSFICRIAIAFSSIRRGNFFAGDSARYVRFSDQIIHNGLASTIKENFGFIYYIGYPLFITPFRMIFGENYLILIIFQIVLGALSSVLLYRIITLLANNNQRVAFIIAILYNINLDVIKWDGFVLTDGLGMVIAMLLWYSFLQMNRKGYDIKYFLCFSGICVMYFLFRTTALLVIMPLFIYSVMKLSKKFRLIVIITGAIVVGAFSCMMILKGGIICNVSR